MYDQIFSPLWWFDRCQEISFFPIFLSLIVVFLLFLFFISKSKLNKFSKSAVLTLSIIYAVVAVPSLFVWGFSSCTASGRYWPVINKVVSLNGELNHLHNYDLPLPKNKTELNTMYPEYVEFLEKQTKYAYIYNEIENRYTLIVRASKYVVAIFDSKMGRATYKIGQFSPASWPNLLTYPPKENGPWEYLPK